MTKNPIRPKRDLDPAFRAATAADLMTRNPISIREHATVKEAAALLTDRAISAAPVINDAGHPVGVVSRTDLVQNERERAEYLPVALEYYHGEEMTLGSGESLADGFQVENADLTEVHDIMTPVVYAVAPETPAVQVVKEMLTKNVHRLFVIDADGVLIGVVSAMDVLRKLQ
jgi:CBS domain-containing protein